jgi:1-acyl-sn-glycerol-3-phosphate acyltransferase
VSPCGPACLSGAGPHAVGGARLVARVFGLFGALLLGVALLPVLPLLTAGGRQAAGRVWARAVLAALGARLVTRGRLPRRGALLVANHISWLDVLAVLAVAPGPLVAKREVRDWPLVGALARAAGTVFVDRSRPRSLPATVAEVTAHLRAGRLVTVFPEGTTTCGGAHRPDPGEPFRPAMFQAAIDARVPVVPVALRYTHGPERRGTAAAAFVGEETLLSSLRRVLGVPGLVVSVTATPALHPDTGADRRALARIARAAVGEVDRAALPTPVASPAPVPAAVASPAAVPAPAVTALGWRPAG